MIIHLLAEGYTEEVVASKLLPFCGHEIGNIYGKCGCKYIHKRAMAFRHLATEYSGVLVLTDFRDTGENCIQKALNKYILGDLPCPPKTFLYRYAVNEIESWLLADREGMAKFIAVPISHMPLQPENEMFPKRTLVNLAKLSRKRKIREGMAPLPEHRANVGPEYLNLLCEFIIDFWNIEAAIRCSRSLEHCVRRLREIE